MEIHEDMKYGKIWLSQQKYVEKKLGKFDVINVKPVNMSLAFHCKFS
jgi:hypothetical protein